MSDGNGLSFFVLKSAELSHFAVNKKDKSGQHDPQGHAKKKPAVIDWLKLIFFESEQINTTVAATYMLQLNFCSAGLHNIPIFRQR